MRTHTRQGDANRTRSRGTIQRDLSLRQANSTLGRGELPRERKLAETISLLSPSEVFRLAASKLCKTDVDAHNRFLDTTRRYREELIQFFKDEKIFDSYEYFTPVPPEKYMTADEILQIITSGKLNSLDEYRAWAKNRSDIFSERIQIFNIA